MKVACALFDMDGVVVDSMSLHAAAWKEVLAHYGIIVSEMDIYRREGMPGSESIIDICHEKGLDPPDEQTLSRLLKKKNAFFERGHVRLYPHVKSIISLFRRQGIPIALVTGSPKRAVHHVIPKEMLRLFDALVTADDVTKGKPDPEPYATAIRLIMTGSKRLGGSHQDNGAALCVENAPLGIQSAKRAGAVCYAIATTLPERFLVEADRVFADHKSLLKFLQRGLIQ